MWQTNLELDQVSDEALYIQDILSDSTHVKIDAEGRVLLSENFINVADLEKTILFAGRGETFQIWNPDKYISEKEERSKRFKLAGPQTLMLKKNNELFFKYLPPKISKKSFNVKVKKESPFNVLKNLNLS